MLLSILKMVAPYLAGGGPAGMAARKAVDWLQEQLEDSGEERINTTRLQPGDRLEVVARPAPTKAERRLEAELAAARDRLAKARAAGPAQVKVAARLQRTQKQLDKAKDGSAKAARLAVREGDLLARFDRLDTRRDERRALTAEIAELSERLEFERADALAAAEGTGTSKRVFFRADD